jgi:hypothetical protein
VSRGEARTTRLRIKVAQSTSTQLERRCSAVCVRDACYPYLSKCLGFSPNLRDPQMKTQSIWRSAAPLTGNSVICRNPGHAPLILCSVF